MGDDPLRQVVGGDLLVAGELTDARYQPHVAADDPAEQTFVTEVIEAALAAVALAGRVNQRQIARFGGFDKALFQGLEQGFRHTDTDEAAGRQGGSIGDPGNRLGCGQQFRIALVHTAESSEAWRRNRSCRACSSSMPWSDSSTKTRWVCAA